MTTAALAVVIPTRNRPDMAITAIRHLVAETDAALQVFVSDNSSADVDVRRLADFCRDLNDPRVTYLRPPQVRGQGSHWDWAVRQALARSNATHVTVHYDRKILLPGGAAMLTAVATRYPDKVFTYLSEFASAFPPPLRLWQPPWTGKLFALQTSRTLEMTARGEAFEISHLLPILSNCVVPRMVVESIVERFGDFCDSTTADSCFTYRFCALHDDYLHLDRIAGLLYGSHRSAGIGYLSGEGGDFADYRQTWRGESWLDAAPLPGVNLGFNMLFHEYELVRRAIGGDRLPPLDRAGCLRDLGRWLGWIRNPEERAQLRDLLMEQGWSGELPPLALRAEPQGFMRGLVRSLRQRVILLQAAVLRRKPATISGFAFASDEEAVRYALRYPRQRGSDGSHLALMNPVEIDSPLP